MTIKRWVTFLILFVGVLLCLSYVAGMFQNRPILIEWSVLPILAVVSLYALSIWSNMRLWRYLLYIQTGRNISTSASLVGTASLMIGKYIPGKVLGIIGRISSVSTQIDSKAATNAALIEQVYLLLSLLALSLLALGAKADSHFLWGLFLLGMCVIIFFPPFLGREIGKVFRGRFKSQSEAIIRLTPQISLLLCFYAFLAAICVITIAWFAVDLLGLDPSPSERFGLIGAYALAITAGMLAIIVPGGIGVREASFVLLAENWIGVEQAIALAAVLRLINVLADLIVGVVGVGLAKIMRE